MERNFFCGKGIQGLWKVESGEGIFRKFFKDFRFYIENKVVVVYYWRNWKFRVD